MGPAAAYTTRFSRYWRREVSNSPPQVMRRNSDPGTGPYTACVGNAVFGWLSSPGHREADLGAIGAMDDHLVSRCELVQAVEDSWPVSGINVAGDHRRPGLPGLGS